MIFKVLLVIVVVLAVLYVVGMVLRQRPPAPAIRFTEVGELSDEWRQRIDDALARGKKIEAIKAYREATRAGLADAKAAVETYAWKRGS